MKDPELFYDFYRKKIIHSSARPNSAHIALAKLEEKGKLKAVITQNIDGLHQLAGSRNVYEIHGSVHRNYCMSCGGLIKPDVVLYEESLDQAIMMKSIKAIQKAEVLIVGGTSLSVYPAAGLIQYFDGRSLVLINKGETMADDMADLRIYDSIGKVLGDVIGT